MTMDIKPVKTKTDYQAALKEIGTLMDAKPRTSRGDRLDVLVTLVEAYEARHYPLDLPDPVEAIKLHHGKQRGIYRTPIYGHPILLICC
jgi:HTH-type transcriptional regulator / antitoxin HigA